jgi:hypothetical protein
MPKTHAKFRDLFGIAIFGYKQGQTSTEVARV